MQHKQLQGIKCIMISVVKGQSHIKMQCSHHISKILVVEHWFCHLQPQN